MFTYLGVLISVILGLAITHLVVGVSKLIQMRQSIRVYWVHVVWTLNVLIFVLALWWGMFWWNNLLVWTFAEFFFITGYAIVLALMAAVLYPFEFVEGLDFEEYFFHNKNWFFGIFLTATLLDVVETEWKGIIGLRPVPAQYVIYIPICLVLGVIALTSSGRKTQAVSAVGWTVVTVSYILFSVLARITSSVAH